jgi:hypothetical protein
LNIEGGMSDGQESIMERDPSFTGIISPEDLVDIDDSSNTIYALWPDLRLAMVNQAWFDFARDNGADDRFFARWPIGGSIEDTLREPGGLEMKEAIERALDMQTVQSHTYQCSSPTIYRLMRVDAYPLGDQAILLSHAQVARATHDEIGREASPGVVEDYSDEVGMVVMCSGCRRARRPHTSDWDWVPDFIVRVPPNVSHGFCPNVSHGFCPACKSYWMSPVTTPRRF